MARPGITYVDVAKSAELITSQGQNPTVDRVLANLGTGSKSTIAPLLKKWKAEKAEVVDTSHLPDEILKAAANLHEQLQQTAALKIEQANNQNQTKINNLMMELDEASKKISDLQQIAKQDSDSLHNLGVENKEQKSRLEDLRIKTSKFEVEISTYKDLIDDKKSIIQEQKSELYQTRKHLEHYQQQIAEERQRERTQFQSVQNQLELRLNELTKQFDNEKKQRQLIDDENSHLRVKLEQATQEVSLLKENSQAFESKLTTYQHDIADLNGNNSALHEEAALAKKTLNKVNQEKKELEITHRLLQQRYEQLEQKLTDIRDQNMLLTDENKILIQEKSVLQGQLKQLCEVNYNEQHT